MSLTEISRNIIFLVSLSLLVTPLTLSVGARSSIKDLTAFVDRGGEDLNKKCEQWQKSKNGTVEELTNRNIGNERKRRTWERYKKYYKKEDSAYGEFEPFHRTIFFKNVRRLKFEANCYNETYRIGRKIDGLNTRFNIRLRKEWEDYKKRFDKIYKSPKEDKLRQRLWILSLDENEALDQCDYAQNEIDERADMTLGELKNTLGSKQKKKNKDNDKDSDEDKGSYAEDSDQADQESNSSASQEEAEQDGEQTTTTTKRPRRKSSTNKGRASRKE